MMRLIFFGTSHFALLALESLCNVGHAIVAVVTQPDKPVGRHQRMEPPPVKIRAQELGLAVLQPEALKDVALPPAELGVVASYGKIIPNAVLDHFPKGVLNMHPSLLPKYRGPTPIQTAIANDERETGVTISLLDEEIDHGPIIARETVEIFPDNTTPLLASRLAKVGTDLLLRTMPMWLAGKITPRSQDHAGATFTKMLTRDDGRINWQEPAEVIARKLRAYTPWPGIWTTWQKRRVRINGAGLCFHALKHESAMPGTVCANSDGLHVACGAGTLEITTLQPEGGREMTAAEFIRGHAGIDGAQLR